MTQNISEFWADVKAKEQELAGQMKPGQTSLFIVSVTNREKNTTAGSICEVTVRMAAEGIAKGTHRLATKQEIAQYEAWQDEQRQLISEQEYQRKQQFALPREFADLLRVLAPQQPATTAKEK